MIQSPWIVRSLQMRGISQTTLIRPRFTRFQLHCARREASGTQTAEIVAAFEEFQGRDFVLLSPPAGRNLKRVSQKHVLPVYSRIKGEVKYFDAVLLRDMCQCEACVDPKTHQKIFQTAHIPANIAISSASNNDDGGFDINWHQDIANSPTPHSTRISEVSLQRLFQGSIAQTIQPLPVTWTPNSMKAIMDSGRNKVRFEDLISQKSAFERILLCLRIWGLAIVTNVPPSEQSVEQIGETIGPLRHTFYGRTWDVKDKRDAQNVAYTSHFLGMHMDLLYMKQPPGLQLLHCLASSCAGGESLFSDSLHAANDLHVHRPDLFNALAKFPVSYHYQHPGRHFYDRKPTFELDPFQENQQVPGAAPPRVDNINWSPPFQGPLDVDTGTAASSAALGAYHEGAREFAARVDSDEYLFRIRLEPGECVIFNNRRVLHGRAAFESGVGERWLKGAYLDTDDFESCVRQIVNVQEKAGRLVQF